MPLLALRQFDFAIASAAIVIAGIGCSREKSAAKPQSTELTPVVAAPAPVSASVTVAPERPPADSIRDLVVSAQKSSLRLKFKDAESQLKEAITKSESLKDANTQHVQGDLFVQLAEVQIRLKNAADAEAAANRAVSIAEKLVTDASGDPRGPSLLASAVCQWGDCQLEREPRTALERYERAVKCVEPIHAKDPSVACLASSLRYALEQRAQAKLRLKRLVDARVDWKRAVALESPDARMAQLARWSMGLAHAGYVTEAVLALEPLVDGPNATAETIFSAVRIHAQISFSTADADADHSGRALELLNLAVKRGFSDAERVKADEDLAQLRERFEYRRLVAEMEKRPK